MGFWQPQLAALPARRWNATACFHAGKVYVFGGDSANSATSTSYQNTLYIFDPAAGTWSTGATLPATGLCYAFSTAADGIHLIYPGTGAHYTYDPAANTYTLRASTPVTDRRDAHHFTDASGRIYLAGGQATSGTCLKVQRYDPSTDTWSTRPDMPIEIAGRGATVAPGVLGSDGKVYLGYGGFTKGLTVYDPTTETWGTTAAMPDTQAVGVSVARLPSGIVLALPHETFAGGGGGTVLRRRIDGYDPATGVWTMGIIPDFPGSSYATVPAVQPGGLVFLLGGLEPQASPPDIPSTQAWAYQQNEAPTAPTLRTMVGGQLVSTAATNRAAHTFNDPNAGDSQSAFDHRYRLVGDANWTTATISWPNPYVDFLPGDLTPGDWERQVRTYDSGGLSSPWSASGFFTAADPPAGPSITAPINGQTVEQNTTVSWSASSQQSWQLRRVADNGSGAPDTATVYADTGEVTETLTRSTLVTFDTNNRTEHVQIRIKDAGLWSDWVSVMVEVSYTPPPAPTFTIYTDESTASLLIMITNPAPTGADPAAAYNDIWIDDGDGEERRVTQLATNAGWRHWTPVSGRDYSTAIRVVAVASNGTTSSSS